MIALLLSKQHETLNPQKGIPSTYYNILEACKNDGKENNFHMSNLPPSYVHIASNVDYIFTSSFLSAKNGVFFFWRCLGLLLELVTMATWQ